MKNMKKFFDAFQSLNGSSFISINNYIAKTTGEIANHVINVGISINNAKQTDLNRLMACNDHDIQTIADQTQISLETVKIGLSELQTSAQKNIGNPDQRTNQSKAQTDAYIFINDAIKLHKDTLEIFIFGQTISKKILVSGEYKSVKSSDKTIAKNAIKKHLDLRSEKFREFSLGNIQNIKISGDTIELKPI